MGRSKTTIVAENAQAVRDAQAALADAIHELEDSLARDGWTELSRHSVSGSNVPTSVTYVRPGHTIDRITGQATDGEVTTLASIIEGGAP